MMDDTLTKATALCTRSLNGAVWRLRDVPLHAVQEVALAHDIPEMLARLVLARGIAPEEVHDFLNPSLKNSLPNPSHLKDMDAGAERIAAALIAGEKIAIFGDYDVDGATSSALLMRFFRMMGAEALLHIPDRMKEGYGPNATALLGLKAKGASVIITVDCGTLAHSPLEAAHEAGLDVIVVDHHQSEARLPTCFALINPNRLDETSPHRHLAAVGVAFLLCVAVVRALRAAGFFTSRPEPELLSLLDIVALGTVCDVVALTGANRAFVSQGLKVMAARRNIGIRMLMDVARADSKPNAYTCGFLLGPRINAGGRVGKSDLGARLLATDDEAEALHLARELDLLNDERRAIEKDVLEQAFAMAAKQEDAPVLVIAREGWHAGVIGIVASRLKERFHKPVAVIALGNGMGKASARSISGFDFGASVIAAVELGILEYGGGHAMAAGFTVREGNIPALQTFLSKRLTQALGAGERAREVLVDGVVALSGITISLAETLERAGPFGQGNAQARFVVQRATLAKLEPVGEDHLRLILTDGGKARVAAMAFRAANTPLGAALPPLQGKQVDVLGTLKLGQWQGAPQVTFTVEDVAV